jgi:uncharacterized membrane protein
MSLLLSGLIIFFAVHAISIVNEPWRDRMAATMGEWPWKGLYSVISIIGFVVIVWGYCIVRYESAVIYVSAPWLTHLAMLLLVPVFPLLLATYLPGRISVFAKHPMLLATILWAFSHLLINGHLSDILLFGVLFVWAVLDLLSMRKRTQRSLPGVPKNRFNDFIAMVAGLALFGSFYVWLHGALIGISLVG